MGAVAATQCEQIFLPVSSFIDDDTFCYRQKGHFAKSEYLHHTKSSLGKSNATGLSVAEEDSDSISLWTQSRQHEADRIG